MSLSLRAVVRDRGLDVGFEVPSGQTLALLGPNASGKSSTLAVLAGLLRPDDGTARLGDELVFEVRSGRGAWRPPHRRSIGMLTQDPLLFPRMTVLENVAFGLRSRGMRKGEARSAARRWLVELDAADLANREPAELSGGQQQRVALARALATEPALLLLDEPLSATDVDVAAAMRQTLRRVLANRTAVVVTHQVLDAVLLCDRVAVMERGRIVEAGRTDDVLRRPRSQFAASMGGFNMLRGTAIGARELRTPDGIRISGEVDTALTQGEPAVAIFRPAAVSVHLVDPGGSPRNHFTGRVTSIEPQAHLVRIRMGQLSADITPESVAQLDVAVGRQVVFAVKAAEVSLYPA